MQSDRVPKRRQSDWLPYVGTRSRGACLLDAWHDSHIRGKEMVASVAVHVAMTWLFVFGLAG